MSRSPHPAQPSQRDVGDALTEVVKGRLRAHVAQIGAFSVPGAGGWTVEVVDPDEPVNPDSSAIVVVARRAEDGRRLLFDLRVDAYASPHVPPGWGWYRRGPGVPDYAVGDRVEVFDVPGLPSGMGEVVEVLGDMSDPRPGYRVQLDDADTYETVVVPPEGLAPGGPRE